jgi:hypothetical protein
MALVKLMEVRHNLALTTKQDYTVQEVFVNPEHVVMIREEPRTHLLNEQGVLPKGIESTNRFTKLTINRGQTGTEIVVLGSPDIVENSLNRQQQLLRG